MLLKTIRGYIFYKRLLDLDTGKIYHADFHFNMYGMFVITELPKEIESFGMNTQIVKWRRYSDAWKWFYIDEGMIRGFKRKILRGLLSSYVHRKAPNPPQHPKPQSKFPSNPTLIHTNSATTFQKQQNKNKQKFK